MYHRRKCAIEPEITLRIYHWLQQTKQYDFKKIEIREDIQINFVVKHPMDVSLRL